MRFSTQVFTAALLAGGLLFLVAGAGFAPGSRVIPVSVAVPLCALLTWQLVRDVRALSAASLAAIPVPHGSADPGTAVGNGPASEHDPATAHEAVALGWLLGLAASLALTGFLAGPTIWVALYLRRRGDESWPAALAGGAAAAILIWLLLVRVLAAPIAGGWIGSLIAAVVRAFG